MPGVACIMVAPVASSNAASALPSIAVSRGTITTSAPAISGSMSSSTAMSKDSVVTAASLSSAVIEGSRRMLCKKLATAPCGTQTPFGLPVEPDV